MTQGDTPPSGKTSHRNDATPPPPPRSRPLTLPAIHWLLLPSPANPHDNLGVVAVVVVTVVARVSAKDELHKGAQGRTNAVAIGTTPTTAAIATPAAAAAVAVVNVAAALPPRRRSSEQHTIS